MAGERLENDHSFECKVLQGKKLESLIGYYDAGMHMLILKLEETELYQRFFLDAGIGFWEEWDKESAFDGYEDMEEKNLAENYGLVGKKIINIGCFGSFEELSTFIFNFGEIKLKLSYIDANDLESETELSQI